MDYTGKAQLTIIMVAPAEMEAEGDRLFESHAAWMERTHHREGEKALLQYAVSKRFDDDGNVVFILTEIYNTVAGIEDHHAQGRKWNSLDDWVSWMERCQVTAVEGSLILHSLW